MVEASISVRGVAFQYPDGTEALSNLSFEIPDGHSVGLIGANGAGKSTLLMHLNGCLLPGCGEIVVGGTPVAPATLTTVRQITGTMFHDPDDQLFMPTVFEDVAFGLLNQDLSSEEISRRVSAVLSRVGALHLRERQPYRLSAGEKRSVCLASVLVLEPAILLMDEPSAGLDPRGRRQLISQLKTFSHTMVIATHDLELVAQVCSEVIVLSQGSLIAYGETRTLLNDEALMVENGLERPHILDHAHPHPRV